MLWNGWAVRLGAVTFVLTLAPVAASAQQDPRAITFDDAISIALRQSSAIARVDNQAELDRIAVTDARMSFLPDLRVTTSGSQGYGGTGPNGGSQTMSTRLSSSVVLFDGFANVARLKGARLEESAGAQDAARTRQDVVFAVISGFLGLIESGEQSRVAAENLAAQQQREGDVKVLVERGSRPIADLYQQQAAVAAARSTLVGSRRAQELARVELVQALRLDPAASYEFIAPELREPSLAEPAPDVAALVSQALGQRPDLGALDTRLSAAEQAEKAAAAGRWPSLSLSVGYGANYSTSGPTGFADQLDASRAGSLSLGLSFPVFDGLTTRLARERASVQTDNARIALDDMRQQVALEVRRAVLDRQAAIAALDASSARVEASRRALEATEARYDAGVATLFEVTQARADDVDATSAEIRARYSLLFEDRVLDYYTGALDPVNGIAL